MEECDVDTVASCKGAVGGGRAPPAWRLLLAERTKGRESSAFPRRVTETISTMISSGEAAGHNRVEGWSDDDGSDLGSPNGTAAAVGGGRMASIGRGRGRAGSLMMTSLPAVLMPKAVSVNNDNIVEKGEIQSGQCCLEV